MPLLEVNGLVAMRDGQPAVAGVSFHVDDGEIVGLFGPEGGGMTTVMRIVAGIEQADQGRIVFAGEDITAASAAARQRLGLGHMDGIFLSAPRRRSWIETLIGRFRAPTIEQSLVATIQRNPRDGRRLTRAECWQRATQALEQFGLTNVRRLQLGQLSSGERRRVQLAQCLALQPRLLVLENPGAGVDPVTQESIRGLVRSFARDLGIGILLADHDHRNVLGVCDRAMLIRYGRVCAQGKADEIISDPAARRDFFGLAPRPMAESPRPRSDDLPPELAEDIAALNQLLEIDTPSSLNKLRFITEKMLRRICSANGVGWGEAEPTLERMIGPLVASGVLPRNVAVHVRTIQTNTSPGSHYQEAPLGESHVTIARQAFEEFLRWYRTESCADEYRKLG